MEIKNRILIEKRWNALKNEYNYWRAGHTDLQRFINPTRGFFEGQIPNFGKTPDAKTQLDGVPQRAANTLASGMTSGLTSPARPWFKLGLQNHGLMEIESVKEWLDLVQQKMMSIFSKSNIYGVFHSIYEEIGTFGTACTFIVEDFETVIRAKNYTIGEYYIGTSARGIVDSFARFYWMTVGQLVEEFGLENCSPATQVVFKNNHVDNWVRVCHLIEPNNDRIPDKQNYGNKAFRSIQWEYGSPPSIALRVSGYDEFPVLAPRWSTTTTSFAYGFGPGHKALGDVKMLMKMQKEYLVALDKAINPPMVLDGSVQGEGSFLPGGSTRSSSTNPNSGARPAYQIQPDLDDMQKAIERTQEAIKETFFYNLFHMLDQQDGTMTATEVTERMQEKNIQLGSVLERLESELLDPLISRTFGIMLRTNILPPPPPEMQGQEMKVEYISILAQAQKMVGTSAIQQVLAFVGQIAAVDPSATDTIDVDETIRVYAEMMGVPPQIIRSPEVIAAVRQAKQQQQEAAQRAAALPEVVQGAKNLSETKMGQNSALDALVGNQSGGSPAPKKRAA